MGEVRVEDPALLAFIKRWWWLIILVLGVLGFLCVALGPGQFLIKPAPASTEAQTEAPPADQATETAAPTEKPTEKATEKATEEATEPATPTEQETATEEATQVVTYVCVVNPNDGICSIGCENTDLDSNACKCNFDNKCDKQEGFNCPDCSFGQCGSACKTDKDCHNPYLTCNGGSCDGNTCPANNAPACDYDSQCSNVVFPTYTNPNCYIKCPGGGKVKDPFCQLFNQTCGG